MKLIHAAFAALALLCAPAFASEMGSRPGARVDPGENVKAPPGHASYDRIKVDNKGTPTELPQDGRKRLACETLGQIQSIFAGPTIQTANEALGSLIAGRKCYPSVWSEAKVIEAVEITYPWNFSDGTHPAIYALHVVFPDGANFWVVWLDDAPTS